MNIMNQVTLRVLKQNRLRTLVTIIGIILSAAMFTAVTTSVASLQNFFVEVAIEADGDWHGAALDVSAAHVENLQQDAAVRSYTYLQNIGYAPLEDIANDYKPYLFVAGMGSRFAETMPVNITEGRLPANSSEIILPKHLYTGGRLQYATGDTLSLEIGERMIAGSTLNQMNSYLSANDGDPEELIIREQRAYTVVGFYERPSFEHYSAPGYTALTLADGAESSTYNVYIKLNKPRSIYNYLETKFAGYGSTTNTDVLRFSGASDEREFNQVLYGLAAVLIGMIMFGSVSLIYNAFSISVSERTKQFGLLSSIGATKQQLMHSVLFEAFFLSIVGIPAGVLSGVVGIGITLKVADNMLMSFLDPHTNLVLDLYISWFAIASAALLGLITVMISAYLPAKRAVKVSPIDAIRQSSDITIKGKQVKTSRLTYKLFGFEGMLASKYFKRNRKKYRATVLSLFLSVVLFISASSFSTYLQSSATAMIDNYEYDIILYDFDFNGKSGDPFAQYEELASIEGVTQAGYGFSMHESAYIPVEAISDKYLQFVRDQTGEWFTPAETMEFGAEIHFVEDALYEAFLTENSLDPAVYLHSDFPPAVALDFMKIYNGGDGRYYFFNLLEGQPVDVVYKRIMTPEGYYFWGTEQDEDGNEIYVFQILSESGETDQIRLSAEEATVKLTLPIGAVTDQKPFVVDNNESGITLIYPYRAMKAIIGQNGEKVGNTFYFKAENHKAVYDQMIRALDEEGLDTSYLYNIAERAESDRALVAGINLFSYGFIVLISLIAAANVFNTISTNVGLRRREFAMLKSIGMTQKGFNRMMNFECLLYGFRGLLYGIPVSFGVTYLIYRSILSGMQIDYFIPWQSVAIAVGSVFVVVFATMIYATNKIKNDNLIDALRNENL